MGEKGEKKGERLRESKKTSVEQKKISHTPSYQKIEGGEQKIEVEMRKKKDRNLRGKQRNKRNYYKGGGLLYFCCKGIYGGVGIRETDQSKGGGESGEKWRVWFNVKRGAKLKCKLEQLT